MELRKYQHQDADVPELAEGKMTNGVSASRGPVLRSLRTPDTPRNFVHENRETSGTPAAKAGCGTAGEG
jgi:hypothetical protein